MASCICSCDGVESLGACAPPKTPVGTVHSGSISICNSRDEGIGFAPFPVIMTSGCRYVGSIERSDFSNSWFFNVVSAEFELGGSVQVFLPPEDIDPHCEFFDISWGVGADGGPFITVRGRTNLTSPTNGILDGIAYAVAPISSAWALGGGAKGLALFEDGEGATFEDGQPAQFSI